MATIIKVNNRDGGVGWGEGDRTASKSSTHSFGNRRRSLSVSEIVFLSCTNCGKLSGTSLLTNKVSRGTLIINHLPGEHKESWRD